MLIRQTIFTTKSINFNIADNNKCFLSSKSAY